MPQHVWINTDEEAEQNECWWPALFLWGALKSSLASRRSRPVETAQAQHFITVSPCMGQLHLALLLDNILRLEAEVNFSLSANQKEKIKAK